MLTLESLAFAGFALEKWLIEAKYQALKKPAGKGRKEAYYGSY